MATLKPIAPCLWFNGQAEEAARYYVSLFPDSGIDQISHYGKEGFEVHGWPEGAVMLVAFHLAGQPFTALNGGPQFKFSEAISFQITCDTQAEIDHYWDQLSQDGVPGVCGWLKDKFGLSWQIVPSIIPTLMADPTRSAAVMRAVMQMRKPDLAALQRAGR